MPQHAVAILLGSLLAFYGNQLPDQYWSAFAPICLLLCFSSPAYRFVLLITASFLWSSGVLHYHLEHRLADSFDSRVSLLRGIVSDIPEINTGRIRLNLKSLEIESYTGSMPRRVRLNWYQDEVVPQLGEYWQFEVKLKQPRGMLNPTGFDYEAWQFQQGIDASGYIRNSTFNARLDTASAISVDHWRMRLAREIDYRCKDCEYRSVIKALALGFRGDISTTQRQLLQSSGTAHLLAISGLHIGMVSMLFYGIGRVCWRLGIYRSGLNRIQVASLLAICAATGYSALADFSLPTIRALVMLSVVFLALQMKNRINLLQSIALAMVAILVVDPRSVGSASFWLSFGALLVIAFFQFRRHDNRRWWQQIFKLQLYFSLFLAPLGVLIFGQFNPAGLLANIVAIPLISFAVLPLVLGGCLLAASGFGIAQPVFKVADGLLGILFDYFNWLIDSGLQSVIVTYPALLSGFALISVVLFLMPGFPGGRKAALIAIAVIAGWQPARLKHGEFEIIVLDVGMGTSMYLRTRNYNLVYDLGPGRPNSFNAADWALLPIMRLNGFSTPDLLVVSHVDQDHSGGLHSWGNRYRQSRLVSGTPAELELRYGLKHRVRSCHDFPDWRWDGVVFHFLSAGKFNRLASSNNRSCVLSVRGNHHVLIPGDIEASQEAKLMARYGVALAADVLLAPHHGSNTSSSRGFVNLVRPGHVVFTLARNNRWGFPRKEVISRYDEIGSHQYRSDREGAISVTSSRQGLVVKTMRNPKRRIWRRW